MKRFARPLLALVFAGSARDAVPDAPLRRPPPRPAGATATPVDRYGFRLDETAKAAGLDFVHEAPTLDPKLAHIMPQVASMGAAVSVVDFDARRRADLYVTNSREGSQNRLYRNRGDGTFEDVAGRPSASPTSTAPETGVSMGAVWGDYDNDGFEDLLLYHWGRPDLFRNDGGAALHARDRRGRAFPPGPTSTRRSGSTSTATAASTSSSAATTRSRVNLWKLADTKIMPESFEYAKNGGRKYLFRNLGDGRFEDVSERVGLDTRRWALAAVAADLRGTGYPDLFIANDYGVSELFLNEGGRFREVGRETGVGYAPKSGMNAVGRRRAQPGALRHLRLEHLGGGHPRPGEQPLGAHGRRQGGLPKYENLATAMGVDLGGWSFGAQFGDLNNDGTLDLYLVNGYVSASKEESYWYDYSKIAGGHELVISDAKNWPPMGDAQPRRLPAEERLGQRRRRPLPRRGPDGGGERPLRRPLRGRSPTSATAACSTWWSPTRSGPLLLYRNEVAPDAGLDRVRPRGELRDGRRRGGLHEPQRDRRAVRVSLERTGAGPGGLGRLGLLRAEPAPAPLRPGPGGAVEKAVVRWPSGKIEELSAAARRTACTSVKEPA